jgi:nitrogen fixation protein NifQ
MRGSDPAVDRFDLHVVACILSLAFWETIEGEKPLSATTGLEPAALTGVMDSFFPDSAYIFPTIEDIAVERGADEACLLDLLSNCASDHAPLQKLLAAMIARRAQSRTICGRISACATGAN